MKTRRSSTVKPALGGCAMPGGLVGVPAGEAILCTEGPVVAARLVALGGESRIVLSFGSILLSPSPPRPGDAADRLTEPFDEDDAGPDDMVTKNQGEGNYAHAAMKQQ